MIKDGFQVFRDWFGVEVHYPVGSMEKATKDELELSKGVNDGTIQVFLIVPCQFFPQAELICLLVGQAVAKSKLLVDAQNRLFQHTFFKKDGKMVGVGLCYKGALNEGVKATLFDVIKFHYLMIIEQL